MPNVLFSEQAQQEFAALDKSARLIFAKHILKFETCPPKRHLKGSGNYAVENVGQGRVVCKVSLDNVEILHVFPTHKDYERWYRGQK